MKLIYTLAAAALCSGMVSAEAANRTPVRSMANLQESPIEMNIDGPSKKAKAQSTRADEDWKSLGEGKYREFVFSSMFRGLDPEEVEVTIEQSVSDPSCYRLVNMYQNYELPFPEEYMSYDATSDNYLYINTFKVDGKTYWYIPEMCGTGIYVEPAMEKATGLASGTMSIMYFNQRSIAEYGAEYVFERMPTLFGTYNEKEHYFQCAKNCTGYDADGNATEYPILMCRFSTQQDGYGYYVNTKGQFALAEPGYELPAPPDPFGSYELVGECDMQNYILDNFFQEWTTKVGKVLVYQETGANKQFFHIKNAYVAGAWNTPEQAEEIDFEIDLRDPKCGMMAEQTTGYEDDIDKEGEIEIMSASMALTQYSTDRMTKEEFLATYPEMAITLDPATKKINIPATGIWYYLPYAPETSDRYGYMFGPQTDDARASWIQLPTTYQVTDGVNEISEDVNAPVAYYNMQGVKIVAPAKGELVIKRQGGKAVKMIAK